VAVTLPTTSSPAVIAAIVVLTLLVFVGVAVWASRHLFRHARAERGFDEAVDKQRRRRR
jgi:hypothetical protein